MNKEKTISELETICQPYILSDSKVYEIIKQGSEDEYLDYLKAAITGIINEKQSKYQDVMTEASYKRYITNLNTYIFNNKVDEKLRREVFKDIAEGLLIGGYA